MNGQDLTLIREKHAQLDALLPGMTADAWLIPCREGSDRAATLFAGFEVIGETVFVFTRAGKKIALVTDYDRHDAERAGFMTRSLRALEGSQNRCAALFRRIT